MKAIKYTKTTGDMLALSVHAFVLLGLLASWSLTADAVGGEGGEEGILLPRVPIAAEVIKLDGDVSEEAWKKSLELKLDGFCDQERRDKKEKPQSATLVRVCSDKTNLYLAFTCEEKHPDGPWVYEDARSKRRGNSHVWGGDYVAVYIDMGRWGFYNYYSIAVNAKGEVYRSFTWPARYDLILRDIELPEVKAAAKVSKKAGKWNVEISIPMKTLLRYPADGLPKRIGLDLRRVQWGQDRGKGKFKIYWTGMVCVSGKAMNEQYARMSTWKPLFKTYPNSIAYAAGRGWAQLIFAESFGHVYLDAGKIDNKLVSGQGNRLIGMIGTRSSWRTKKTDRDGFVKAFDRQRMEQWADLRQVKYPENKPRIASTRVIDKTGLTVSFKRKPSVTGNGKDIKVAFEVSKNTDVAVAVLDSKGKIVRHLAAGMLGSNPPQPFKKDSLAQELAWDGKDDFGRPLPAGAYRIRVSAGLKATLDHKIPITKDYWSSDKTPTDKGLDIDNMPQPKIGKSLGHFSRGTMNYLSVDRNTEELYVQTHMVYDGRTGKKLRDLKLEAPRTFALSKGSGNGEIFVSPRDNLLYIGGPNEVWRFSREGKKAPFADVGRHFLSELWGAHSNPHRGVCVGPDGSIYKVHHFVPHLCTQNQITRIGPDGRIKDYGFIRIDTLAAGLRVDSKGNVYVGCTAQPADALPPRELASRMPERARKLFKNVYGSIVKFGPKGGRLQRDKGGELIYIDYRSRPVRCSIRGAEWIRPGFSPMLSRVSDSKGGPGCTCRNARFDLDGFDRLFIPDAVSGRIDVIDSNANTIMLIGGRGKAGRKSGIEFGWPTQVAVSDEACYVADYLRFKISRLKLGYQQEAEVTATVR
jgi:hypothetical protein